MLCTKWEKKVEIPSPIANKNYSGKSLVRIPPEIYRTLAIQAAEAAVSLNRMASATASPLIQALCVKRYILHGIYLDMEWRWIYIYQYRLCIFTRRVWDMDTAKLFINGRSQAVRLPKSYRFEGKEVYVKKVSEGVLLLPKDKTIWDAWERNLQKYDSPFMVERNQPESQQQREGLDDVFD